MRSVGGSDPDDDDSSTKSPYTLSYWGQIKLCLKRGFWRLKADPTLTLTQLFGNFIMSLVIGSVFVNQRESAGARFGCETLTGQPRPPQVSVREEPPCSLRF